MVSVDKRDAKTGAGHIVQRIDEGTCNDFDPILDAGSPKKLLGQRLSICRLIDCLQQSTI